MKIKRKFKKYRPKIFSLNFALGVLVATAFFLSLVLLNKLLVLKSQNDLQSQQITKQKNQQIALKDLQNKVIKDSFIFKIKWGDLGERMVKDGVIDKAKFINAVLGSDKLPQNLEKYFQDGQNQIELTKNNSQFWVDMLWGLGLANKNKILEEGEMMADGDASNFASTGGWTIGAKEPMEVYSKYEYLKLTESQQNIVLEIASNVYRPCCGNSTAFPDCNHGMAALGLIELMVSQNFSKDEIYKTVLAFNTYWFPQTYLDTALYLQKNGEDYSKISPKKLLSKAFSSAEGASAVSEEVEKVEWPLFESKGGSCGA
ncbi:MAG: hypothetical protein UR81_C0016G0002 [Candidatus Levybacteria bacterium GW2011_GWB1_35_5]|nr:MAG: hypothetical protein UR81_C0016G0002 [Candidatus Levybacteria bacterium GW2011_GWB1_35_5]